MRGEMKSLGRCERRPPDDRFFPLTASTLRVDDRFVGGHGRAFGPPAPKVVELHGFTQSCRPVFILGLVYYESRLTGSFANRLGHAEQPGGFGVAVGLSSCPRQALQRVG